MTHAIRLHRTGPPEALSWEEVEPGPPGHGEALLEQHAIGVNFIDTYHRSGLYPLDLPSGIGMEAAGMVLEVGDGVTEVLPGDRVAYVSGAPGAYAERRVVSASRLIPLPDFVDDATAAAAMLKAMTVEALIHRVYRVKPGETVLLHAAAGGVGILACQWLARLGARVIATAGSARKAALARDNGAHVVIDGGTEDFVARVREETNGKGVSVVYDGVGRATFRRSLECLAPRGTMVLFGNASGKPDAFDPNELAARGSLYLTRPVLFHYIASRPELLASASRVFEELGAGTLRPHVGQRFALKDAVQAHRALEARATTGSTLLVTAAAAV
jgi:NADPH2:quinone reductase